MPLISLMNSFVPCFAFAPFAPVVLAADHFRARAFYIFLLRLRQPFSLPYNIVEFFVLYFPLVAIQ